MFQKQISDSSKYVFLRSMVWRQFNHIRTKASATGSFKRMTVLFCVLVNILLLANPFGMFIQEEAFGDMGEFVSDNNTPGATAKAIARFDVVPYQVFSGDFEIGVIAFHINGIQKVAFEYETQSGLQIIESTAMSLNPRTGVCEYWTTLNASDFKDGAVLIKATVYPNNGIERELTLELHANSHKTLIGKRICTSVLTVTMIPVKDLGPGHSGVSRERLSL